MHHRFVRSVAALALLPATYAAPYEVYTLPDLRATATLVGNGIQAELNFTGYLDGKPTLVELRVSGLSESFVGPFAYHVHTNPIGDDGNCTKAFAHLDPYNVTESVACNPLYPDFCQSGDLAGKHGKLPVTNGTQAFVQNYTDDYVRFFPQTDSILGRSVVIHAANKTRLACGSIISVLDDTADIQGKPTRRPSNFTTDLPTVNTVQPTITFAPFDGMMPPEFPSQAKQDAYPFPLALPAVPLSSAVDVTFVNISTWVTLNSTISQRVTQQGAVGLAGFGPFVRGFFFQAGNVSDPSPSPSPASGCESMGLVPSNCTA